MRHLIYFTKNVPPTLLPPRLREEEASKCKSQRMGGSVGVTWPVYSQTHGCWSYFYKIRHNSNMNEGGTFKVSHVNEKLVTVHRFWEWEWVAHAPVAGPTFMHTQASLTGLNWLSKKKNREKRTWNWGKGDDHISMHMCLKISSNIHRRNIKINLCKSVIKGRKEWASSVDLDIWLRELQYLE